MTTTLAATIPSSAPPRLRHAPHQQLRLLHTAPQAPLPPSSARIFSTAAVTAAEEVDTVKGGAVIKTPGVSAVQATFRVPLAEPPTSGPTAGNPVGLYAASFHVGIDSFSGACDGFFRAGVDVFWDGTFGGEQSPFAWYQFGPADAVGFGNFTARAGEVVRITVEDKAAKTATIENFGNVNGTCVKGLKPLQVASQVIAPPAGGGQLCKGEAGFVVEDFPLAGMPQFPVALANFTSVLFKEVSLTAGEGEGQKKNAEGAEVGDIRQARQGGRLTKCAVVGGGKGVKCDRVVGE